jgi:hypothetical protein
VTLKKGNRHEQPELTRFPVPKTGILIRRPVADVSSAGLRALLEHDVKLNLTADRYPKGIRE